MYLMKRKGSDNWRIRIQTPGAPVFEKTLGTPDHKAAEIVALRDHSDKIAEHKATLLTLRPRIEAAWRREYEPGLRTGTNGQRIFATERELHYLDDNGTPLRTVPNGEPEHRVVNLDRRLGIPYAPTQVTDKARPSLAAKTDDDAIIETYLKANAITGHFEREARNVWALYKTLTASKRLKDATREDGRKLAAHYEAEGLKSATIRKKIGWLTAAVNLAIKDRILPPFNAFSGVVTERDDKQTRQPLDAADIKAIKGKLGQLDECDQVLLRLLATTGMRLSEAFEIDGEEPKERGVRFVIIGHKTSQSLRRVPLPAGALAYLPKAIKGRLFTGTAAAASKRLNRFLRDAGITDPRKVLHSLRHRAQDRLRAVECPQDIRWALLGHEDETVAEDYGKGFSVPQLKKWIDKIGM
jgi:integrase